MNYERTINVSPTVTTGGAPGYPIGDVIGGLLTFVVGYRRGQITAVTVTDDDGAITQPILYFYDTQPTTLADNAAFAITDAERDTLLPNIVTCAVRETRTNTSFNQPSVPIPFDMAGNSLYAYLVADAATTFTNATALTIRLTVALEVATA